MHNARAVETLDEDWTPWLSRDASTSRRIVCNGTYREGRKNDKINKSYKAIT